jgi:hypothetical protein
MADANKQDWAVVDPTFLGDAGTPTYHGDLGVDPVSGVDFDTLNQGDGPGVYRTYTSLDHGADGWWANEAGKGNDGCPSCLCKSGENLYSTENPLWTLGSSVTTPTADHPVEIRAAPNHSHNGRLDLAATPQGAHVKTTGFCVVAISAKYFRIRGLRCISNSGLGWAPGAEVAQGDWWEDLFQLSDSVTWRYAISISILTDLTGSQTFTFHIRNNIFFGDNADDARATDIYVVASNTTEDQDLTCVVAFENNTVVNVLQFGQSGYSAMRWNSSRSWPGSQIDIQLTLRNNLLLCDGPCWGDALDDPGDASYKNISNNTSGDTTLGSYIDSAEAAEDNVHNASASDIIVDARLATTNARLRRTSPARGSGADLSGSFTTDARQRLRDDSWDRGALRYVGWDSSTLLGTPTRSVSRRRRFS